MNEHMQNEKDGKIDVFCRKHHIDRIDDFINASQFAKVIGLKNIHTYSRLLASNEKKLITCKSSTGDKFHSYYGLSGIRRILANSRKLIAKDIATDLGIDIKSLYTIPAELVLIEFIMTAFSNENMKHQYIVGKYKIDLFFIDYNLAIEFDEQQHNDVTRKESDNRRQKIIEKITGCTFIRCKLDNDSLSIAKLINKIYTHISNFKQNSKSNV